MARVLKSTCLSYLLFIYYPVFSLKQGCPQVICHVNYLMFEHQKQHFESTNLWSIYKTIAGGPKNLNGRLIK